MNNKDKAVLTACDLWSLAGLGLAALLCFGYVVENWLDTAQLDGPVGKTKPPFVATCP